MRKLETQTDGWLLACDVLEALREAGTERCRANVKPGAARVDALIAAMVRLKEYGTVQCCVGFAVVMCDAIGTRRCGPVPELYRRMMTEGTLRRKNLAKLGKRFKGGGLYLAEAALQREAEAELRGRFVPRPQPERWSWRSVVRWFLGGLKPVASYWKK
jgi:hypothetical protein